MIMDSLPFSEIAPGSSSGIKIKAIKAFIDFLERALGVSVVYDIRRMPFGRPEFAHVMALAKDFQKNGILKSIGPVATFPDEPPIKLWGALDNAGGCAGGASSSDDTQAITATLAETLERYIWHAQEDYFVAPVRSTRREMPSRGLFISPERFSGFSDGQRAAEPELQLDSETSYLWIKGRSLVNDTHVYVPAQTISGLNGVRSFGTKTEPLIRTAITTGLATWPTQEGARLAGALEVLERDAYMIMWLNQFSLPRIRLDGVRARSNSLSDLIEKCDRYHLKVHAIHLVTDAPTHAVCVVLEDEMGHAPRFTLGLKASGSLPHAIESAITEALRTRINYRSPSLDKQGWDPETPATKIGHLDRMYFWNIGDRARQLEFLIRGEEQEFAPAPWEDETSVQQLRRITDWCRSAGYECASVSLGPSRKNPTPWSIEMVVIPEAQPMHLDERRQYLGGTRWKSVPKLFNLAPREKAFSDLPHPFV